MIPIHRQPKRNKPGDDDDKCSKLFNDMTIVTSPLPPIRPILIHDESGNDTPPKLRRPPSKLKLSSLLPDDD